MVVEHDEEIIRAADYIIDIGPKAGRLGGEVVYQGGHERPAKRTATATQCVIFWARKPFPCRKPPSLEPVY